MSDQEKLMQQLKDALVAIRKLKADLQEARGQQREEIAVIGMAMRFPGKADNAGSYWELLSAGRDAIGDVPADRFDVNALYSPQPGTPGKVSARQGGFIDNVDLFDGSFFDITPVEIESMDPQQRLLLELTHEAMENAGQDVRRLVGTDTGVYVGISTNDYTVKHFRSGDPELVGPYAYTGAAISACAGRISYMMGLQGPSMTVDTACSSTLVTAHLAVKALRNRECGMAVVGGANLILEPDMSLCFSGLNALSPDSRCKTFDNSANGYVRSEGCAVMVLKRLADAQRDGDPVLAVIKGSAVNQDGRSNGFTAPNVAAQEQVIRRALEDAGLQPADIAYVEAHGTGTKIGDPIEVEALNKVYGPGRERDKPLLVGSVKSNIGHLESAAGMASIIKAVLCLQHGKLPKSIHFREPNELIAWNAIPIKVVDNLTELHGERPFIATSGFGITGTNAHLILGKAPVAQAKADAPANPSDALLLPLSAKCPGALTDLAGRYAGFLRKTAHAPEDVCASAALHRAHFDLRLAVAATSREGLVEALEQRQEIPAPAQSVFSADEPIRTVFVFSGQGAQWPQMGRELARRDAVFREALEACNQALKAYVDWDVFEELDKGEQDHRLERGDIMQPLLWAVGCATARWWMARGIAPDAVIGHSMGEVAAACIGGQLSLDEGARIISARSALMEQQSGKGAMLATDLSAKEADARLAEFGGKLSVAVMNSPSVTVIGGDSDAVATLEKLLNDEGRFARRVRMNVAAHTAQMDPVLEPLREKLQALKPAAGAVPFYSAFKAEQVKGEQLRADYWVDNVRRPVRFGEAIRHLAGGGQALFLEIGPHAVLTAAVEENLSAVPGAVSAALPSFYRGKPELPALMENLGKVYATGYDLDWTKIVQAPGEFVPLPNYAWQKERFWFDAVPAHRRQPATKAAPAGNLYYAVEWEGEVIADDPLPRSRILVVRHDGNPSEEVCNTLRRLGHDVEVTIPGQVGAALEGERVDRVVYMATGSRDLPLSEAVERHCLGLQSVVGQLVETGNPPGLLVVTGNAFANNGAGPHKQASMLWGMARTVRNEHPELQCKVIDLGNRPEQFAYEWLAQSLEGQTEVRVEAGKGLAPRLSALADEVREPHGAGSQSCYLVTGGTSGLGLAFAGWLASQGVPKIALVSRSGGKPETEAVMESMRQAGAEVRVFRADISDSGSVETLFAEVEQALGPVTGVVHAAGVLDDGTLLNLTRDQFLQVTAPKISGTENLLRALEGRKPERFIAFSSAAHILGSIGQANYNAANFCLDQLVAAAASRGLPAVSVQWGNMGGSGMAASDEKRGARLEQLGLGVIQPAEFDAAFDAAYHTSLHSLAALKFSFTDWARFHPGAGEDPLFAPFREKRAEVRQAEPAVAATAILNLHQLREVVKKHLAAVTGLFPNRIREEDTFKSMGVDSMQALQFRNRIQEETGHNLAVSSVWAHPTVVKYAAFLAAELGSGSEGEIAVENNAPGERQLREMVREAVSSVTCLAAARIREDDTFKSMGIDSMQALQIRNQLQDKLGRSLAASVIWAHPTVSKLAAFLAGDAPETGQPEAVAPTEGKAIEEEVRDLSLDELMKQLEDKSREY